MTTSETQVLTNNEDLAQWERFVNESPQGMLYSHRWWLDAVAPNQYEIFTISDKGRIQAAWPVVWRQALGLRYISMPPLTQKLGILFTPSTAKYAERLSREYKLTEALLGQLPPGTRIGGHNFHESFVTWLPFHWMGCQQSTRYTYVLPDLSNVDGIWQGTRTKIRNDVRKAQKAGIRVRETDDLDEFYRIQSMTYARQSKRNPVSRDLVEKLHTACSVNAGLRLTLAEDRQGRCHAALFTPFDRRCMVVLMSGGDPDLRSSGAGTLLHWDAIQFASTVCQRVDFEGSMVEPIERFYRGFGGQLTPYARISGVLRSRPTGVLRRRVANALRFIGGVIG